MAGHADILADVLRLAIESLELAQDDTADSDVIRVAAATALPQARAVLDVLRNGQALVVISPDGLAVLMAGAEATLDAMRREHPVLAVLPDRHGKETAH